MSVFFLLRFFVALMNRVNITYSSKVISIGDWLSKSSLPFDISYMYYTSIICSVVWEIICKIWDKTFILLIISPLSKWVFSSSSLISFQMAWLPVMNEKNTALDSLKYRTQSASVPYSSVLVLCHRKRRGLLLAAGILRCNCWSP